MHCIAGLALFVWSIFFSVATSNWTHVDTTKSLSKVVKEKMLRLYNY